MTRVLLVTGLSGAGRSTALKALEDFGFEAVDNLPVGLLRTLLRPSERLERDLAIGIDSRSRAFDVRPVVSFDNQASGRFTVIEVNARDRVALLNRLARAHCPARNNAPPDRMRSRAVVRQAFRDVA